MWSCAQVLSILTKTLWSTLCYWLKRQMDALRPRGRRVMLVTNKQQSRWVETQRVVAVLSGWWANQRYRRHAVLLNVTRRVIDALAVWLLSRVSTGLPVTRPTALKHAGRRSFCRD